MILSSYNFIFIQKLSERLEAMMSLIHAHLHDVVTMTTLQHLLLHTIYQLGHTNEHLSINVSMQLSYIVKAFLHALPKVVYEAINHAKLLPVIKIEFRM